MKVVLLEDVQALGHAGDVKDVSDGYARNLLLPKKLAVVATAGELRKVEAIKAAYAQRRGREVKKTEGLANRISETTLTFKAKVGEQHRLYGSITSANIADSLSAAIGETIEKRKVDLEDPIRHLGSFEVPVRLSHDIVPKVKVNVEREDASGTREAEAE